MSSQHPTMTRRQRQRARREINRAIDSAPTRSMRDELIVLARRADLL